MIFNEDNPESAEGEKTRRMASWVATKIYILLTFWSTSDECMQRAREEISDRGNQQTQRVHFDDGKRQRSNR